MNTEALKNRTVISGTLRPQDLLSTFAVELEYLDREGKYRNLISEARMHANFDNCEHSGEVVDELFDALNEFAPEGCYFGAHPDDGADFGFWECDPMFEE